MATKRGEARLHDDAAGEKGGHRVCCALRVGECVEQGHHAAAFGEQGFASGDVGGELGKEFMALREYGGVQLGIAAGQPERVARG